MFNLTMAADEGHIYEGNKFIKANRVVVEKLPDMPGATQRMAFENETLVEVVRSAANGDIVLTDEAMRKGRGAKDSKRLRDETKTDKGRSEERKGQ